MDYQIYKLNALLRNFNLMKMSNYFEDFWFNAPRGVFDAAKDNEETDKQVEDVLAGSTIL